MKEGVVGLRAVRVRVADNPRGRERMVNGGWVFGTNLRRGVAKIDRCRGMVELHHSLHFLLVVSYYICCRFLTWAMGKRTTSQYAASVSLLE